MSSNNNPFQYTTRTFQTALNDINSDSELVNKPSWWKKVWCGVLDIVSTMFNSVVNTMFLYTAYTRQSVKDLTALIDYTLSPHTTSSGPVLFYVKTDLGTAVYPFTVAVADLKARSSGNVSVSSKMFEARGSVTFTLVTDTFTTNYAVNDNLTISTDLEYTGHKVRLTSSGTLPTPLQENTDYFVIYKSSTTIALSETLEGAYAGVEIELTDNGSGTHTVNLFSKVVTMYQQETLPDYIVIGTGDGVTEWQEFDIPNAMFLEDTELMTIQSLSWSSVDTFIDSSPTDRHFKIFPKSDNVSAVRFGNGTYGAIPDGDIYMTYSYGGGSNSNISSVNRITVYAGGDDNLTGVSNPDVLTGGSNEESIESARNLAPMLLKTRDRFITSDDGKALVLAYGGISLCKVNKNEYGPLSCQVVCIADGGGNPSAGVRTALQTYLIARTILESIDVRVEAATITSVAVTAAAKMLSGYSWTNVEPYFTLAFELFLTEAGQEIYDDYTDNGIASAVELINTILTKTFTSDDYEDIQLLLNKMVPRQFGDTIQESDVYAYIQDNVKGIDYMTISVFGSGLPLSLADNEITTVGTLTLTEIV